MSLNDNFCIASMPDDIFFNVSEKRKHFFKNFVNFDEGIVLPKFDD